MTERPVTRTLSRRRLALTTIAYLAAGLMMIVVSFGVFGGLPPAILFSLLLL